MKRLFFLLLFVWLFLPIVPVFAQDPGVNPALSFDLSTFTGIVALISLIVTEIAKRVNFVEKTVWKIFTAIAVGIGLSFISWWFSGRFDLWWFLTGYSWWQVLIQGLFAGLIASGFYDTLKAIGLLRKKE